MGRILMTLDHSFPPDLRVENEIDSLISFGHEVTVLAIGPDERPVEERSNGLTIIRDTISAARRNRMRGLAGTVPVINWYLGARITSIFQDWKFDVIHAHDLYLVGAALKTGRKLGVPVVADLHENWPAALKHYAWSNRFPAKQLNNVNRWDRLETAWTRAADGVIVVIDEMRDRLLAKGLKNEKVLVLPNTIHRQKFDNFGIDEILAASVRSDLTLLYVGGMDKHRGLDTAVRAMKRIVQEAPGAKLVLVGDGAVRTELQTLTSELHLDSSIRFLGHQPQDAVPSFIEGADIGLIPHVRTDHTDHTIPHKLFHYMYLGLPVVASNCTPIKRIILETDAGVIHESGNPSDLADAVLKLSRSESLRNQKGENGKVAVESKYNWKSTSEGIDAFYKQIIG